MCVNYRAQDRQRWDQIKGEMLCCFDLIPVCEALLLLDVHGQHLAAERKALGFLDHLLIRWYGVVAHHHVTLPKKRGEEKRVRAKLREHQSFSVAADTFLNLLMNTQELILGHSSRMSCDFWDQKSCYLVWVLWISSKSVQLQKKKNPFTQILNETTVQK